MGVVCAAACVPSTTVPSPTLAVECGIQSDGGTLCTERTRRFAIRYEVPWKHSVTEFGFALVFPGDGGKCRIDIYPTADGPTGRYEGNERIQTGFGTIRIADAEKTVIETGFGPVAGWSFAVPNRLAGTSGIGGKLRIGAEPWVVESECSATVAADGLMQVRQMLRTWGPAK